MWGEGSHNGVNKDKCGFFSPEKVFFSILKKKLKKTFFKLSDEKMSNTRASDQKWPNLGQIWVNFGQKGHF